VQITGLLGFGTLTLHKLIWTVRTGLVWIGLDGSGLSRDLIVGR
jgi:hypothetical protein